MGLVRLILRIFGWLLTPLVAWAASHFGGAVGAGIAAGIKDPRTGLALTLVSAALAGLLALHFWLKLIRKSPKLQRALHVDPDATPDTSDLLEGGDDHENAA